MANKRTNSDASDGMIDAEIYVGQTAKCTIQKQTMGFLQAFELYA